MAPTRIGLFGFGRTGSLAAHEILRDGSLELAWVVRRAQGEPGLFASRALGLEGDRGPILSLDAFLADELLRSGHGVDVVIDFAGPAALEAYAPVAARRTAIVSAVSAYPAEALALLDRVASKTAVLHSPNITLGINFLLVAAKAMRRLVPDADVAILEEHFRDKADISGTAVRIADALGVDRSRELHSVRAGGIVGKHEIIFGLPNQTVRLVHESIHRGAFGRGAIAAAKWLVGKRPGRYSMEDVVREAMSDVIFEPG
jgi:4-hydroxy-tetrahydrodipicolinate reductase